MAAKRKNRAKTTGTNNKKETVDTSLFDDIGNGVQTTIQGASSAMWTVAGLAVATGIAAWGADQAITAYKKHF